ncbi:MAG: DUF1552 domain-containing protein, partial [Steroidobacteraceae bacterium]
VEDPGANSSSCGEGYSCVYTNTISWQSPTQPLPMEINPQTVFQRMFGDGSSPAVRLARREREASILDSVTGSIGELMPQVPHVDRVRLDQYLQDIREIERRMQIAAHKSTEVPSIPVPYGVPESFHDHVQIQFDLLALAFQADITRVGTMLFARDLTSRVYPRSGTTISFHLGSHHGEDPGQIAVYAKLNRYHVQMFTYLVQKLAGIKEGDGTLLDHSLLLYGSNMGDSNQHLHYDVPHVLVGGASGRLKGDRYLAFYPNKTVPTGNLLLSVLDLMNVRADSFGDSTGRLAGI